MGKYEGLFFVLVNVERVIMTTDWLIALAANQLLKSG